MDSLGTSFADSIDASVRDLGLNSEMPAEPSLWTKEEETHIDSVMCYAVMGGLTADIIRQAYPDCQRFGLPIFKQEGIYRH